MLFSLHLSLPAAAWITFDGVSRLQPGLFLAATWSLGMLHAYWCFLSSISVSLSFFNSHPSNRVSFSWFHLRAFGSSPFRKRPPARLCGRSRACVLVSFPILQLCVSILMRRWPVSRVGAGIRSCALPKELNRKKSYVLPQDHGVLAISDSYQELCFNTRFHQ